MKCPKSEECCPYWILPSEESTGIEINSVEEMVLKKVRTVLSNYADVKIEGKYYFNRISVDTLINLIKQVEV